MHYEKIQFSSLVLETFQPWNRRSEWILRPEWRGLMMDSTLANSVLASGQSNSRPRLRRAASWEGECGHHMSHGSVKHCRIVPSTLNGNISLGQHSMVLHMELQHALPKAWVCVCARVNLRRGAGSVESSCVPSFQLVVTSPNRTGSHALLIQSP